jgi:hypothetical protein
VFIVISVFFVIDSVRKLLVTPSYCVEFRNLLSSANIMRVRREGRVTGVVRVRNVCKIFIGKLEREVPLGIPGPRWQDNIKMDVKHCSRMWTGCISVRIVSSGGSCEHGNETSGYIKGGEFLDYLSDHQLFKYDSAPWGGGLSCLLPETSNENLTSWCRTSVWALYTIYFTRAWSFVSAVTTQWQCIKRSPCSCAREEPYVHHTPTSSRIFTYGFTIR